ncbi:MAG: FMN-binding glutamate synthase family protein, partial [Bacteroidota bacterium]|nr:FMN-binding glutamate synthase family protein [Bacteroidota bacterium]
KNFRKELLEITHACGYEHPCQLTTEDVDLTLGDKNLSQTLAACFTYHKVEVPFEGMSSLLNCQYLGGHYDRETVKSEKSGQKQFEDVRY